MSNPFGSVVDINANNAKPVFICGDDAEVDVGLGATFPGTTSPAAQNNLLVNLANSGAGGIGTVTLQIWDVENSQLNAPLLSAVVTGVDTSLTQAEWNDGTSAYSHASFILSGAVTALAMPNNIAQQDFWLRIFVTTTDGTPKIIDVALGYVTFKQAPVSNVSAPAPAFFRFYTVNGNVVPQIYDPVSGHYYNLEIDTVGGQRSLSLGDTAY